VLTNQYIQTIDVVYWLLYTLLFYSGGHTVCHSITVFATDYDTELAYMMGIDTVCSAQISRTVLIR